MPIINSVITTGGIQPSGTKQITTNGTHDVSAYANADVQVPTQVPQSYRVFKKDSDDILVADNTTNWVPLPSDTKDISENLFYRAYSNVSSTILSGKLDLSSLYSISGTGCFNDCFYNCTGLTSIDFKNLGCINGSGSCTEMFSGCSNVTSIDFSNLCGLKNGVTNMFRWCNGLTDINFPVLTTITDASRMFYECSNLSTVSMSNVIKISSYGLKNTFEGTKISNLSFNKLAYTSNSFNGCFENTLRNVTGCTVHFPSDWETAMSTWSNITNGMGGTNTTVLFDLAPVTKLDMSYLVYIRGKQPFDNFATNNYFPNITEVDLSNLESINGYQACQEMFKNCSNITSVNISKLKTIEGFWATNYMFAGCTGLTSVDLSSLTTIGSGGEEYMFKDCTNLTSVDISNLKTVNSSINNMFEGCTSLTSVSFDSLETVCNGFVMNRVFKDCTSLTSVYFPAMLTNNDWGVKFSQMLSGCSNVTLHFPSNLYNSSYSGSTFGGTNTTLLWDLPPTA